MQFGLPFLIAVLTASAFEVSLIRTHPLWAFSIATLIMVIFSFAQRLRQDSNHGGRLIWTGTAASFIWMMIFGGAAFFVGFVHATATNTWPDQDQVYIDTPTALFIFTIIYGGGAAIVGFLAGCLVQLGFHFCSRNSAFADSG